MNDYGIWLSFNNQEEGFQIPVNPAEIAMAEGNGGATYELTDLGEINVIKSRKLTEFTFKGFLPAHDNYPFLATKQLLPPMEYVNYLLKWMDTKRPIRFVFIGSTFDINEAVSVESFDWKEVAGSVGDIEYSLTLKKYVFYSARRVQPVTSNQTVTLQKSEAQRPNEKQPQKTYTMKPGDTLWTIAKAQLGDGSKWTEIKQLNGITDAQVKSLPAGKVLKLPNA